MKQIISDYIHCTQLEFILKHPLVVLGAVVAAAVMIIAASLIREKWL